MPIVETEPQATPDVDLDSNSESLADLLERLGGISPARVRSHPAPGTATEADWLRISGKTDRLYELVDGSLVEKAVGSYEANLASLLNYYLQQYILARKLGRLFTPDGPFRLGSGLIRLPDLSFVSAARLPADWRKIANLPVAPDLAVEILSPSNTIPEMNRKVQEYFQAGVLPVWIVDPRAWTVRVYEGPENPRILSISDTLNGGTVLPGFELLLANLFK